ncbi:hydrogenase assembly protein HupF [Clostridium carboxidivorans P7]|uniref:Hydrogenase assembly chaperone hypC/hupF n=1 Tax=Clostridium carboxidivorans P7 TaxID=536227 RepID=C6PTB8_9CLOT|nr:HypC/HybG/HupF family hydrogenase formation chaperone [Clostridium carboxidivorans]AKN30469.1 hydrogenase assembly protein HupF [Clostridium carboxidivorans P7]EET87538.1 hydrogenase assembly chaperone hypC/hupF [Clostridium carboxidivorans P7]EFG86210.1 hydrogenase assembly chaperone HypC/HupF [Clostridium carboxidivorans P7]
MCLAVPGKLINRKENRGTVEIGALQREIFIHLVPDVKVGEYVLVHAGCAIEIINEKEAFKTLQILKEIGEHEIC